MAPILVHTYVSTSLAMYHLNYLYVDDTAGTNEFNDSKLPWKKIADALGNKRSSRDYCRRWVLLRGAIRSSRAVTAAVDSSSAGTVLKEAFKDRRSIRVARVDDKKQIDHAKNMALLTALQKLYVSCVSDHVVGIINYFLAQGSR
jgi:hypothetical protein